MKANYSRIMFVLAIAIAILITSIWVAVGPGRASLGNSGVPVRCTASSIPFGDAKFLECVAANGAPFTDGQRVPNGYYLLVTDIVVTVTSWVDNRAPSYLLLHDSFDTNGRAYTLKLRGAAYGNEQYWGPPTYSLHFSSPYMVLPAGHRLEIENKESTVDIYVSGLLVTNVTYIPLNTK